MQKNEIIQKLQALSNKNVDGYNEENVKIHVVIKLLEILGCSDHLDLEYRSGAERPDIIIKGKGFEQPIIIEVKGANEKLETHISQIERYSYSMNSCLSILTNGHLFYFFSPFWKRKSFKERLILSFGLKDLRDEGIIEKVKSLLCVGLGFEQKRKNIEQMENEISNKEAKIKEKQTNILDLKNKAESLKRKHPKIEEWIEDLEHFKPETRSEIENYLRVKKEILEHEKEVKSLKEQIPHIGQSLGVEPTQTGITGPGTPPISLSLPTGDFSMGISDEVINIRALQQGKQISLCKTHEKTNNYVFLVPKSSFESDFEPSEIGRKLMGGHIGEDTTKYVAKIEYLHNIPGKSKGFWQDLYDEKEFNLWDIEKGPWEYFDRSKRQKMILWIFRVYEMPFEIKVKEDFTRHMLNSHIINLETLKRIQSGFNNGEFRPVLTDNEFERRKNKIMEIARKWS